MAFQVVLDITADGKAAIREIRGLQAHVEELKNKGSAAGGAIAQGWGMVTKAVGGVMDVFSKVGLAIDGVQKAWSLIKAPIEAYAEHEKAINRLEIAMAGARAPEGFAKQMDALAESLAKLAGIDDDAVRGVQTLMLEIGVAPEQLEKATRAALDMSKAMGIDFEQAGQMVARTLSGNVREIGRYVPELQNLTKEQLLAGEAIEIVAEKYQGFTEAMSGDTSTSLANVAESFSDLQERIGALIAESPAFTALLETISQVLDGLMSKPEEFSESVGGFITFMINAAAAIKAAFEVIVLSIRTAVAGMITPILWGVAKIVEGLAWAGIVGEDTAQTFTAAADAMGSIFMESANANADAMSRFADAIQGKSELALQFEANMVKATEAAEKRKAEAAEIGARRAALAKELQYNKEQEKSGQAADKVERDEGRKRAAIRRTTEEAMNAMAMTQREQQIIAQGGRFVASGFGVTTLQDASGNLIEVPTPGKGGGGSTTNVNINSGVTFGGEALTRQGTNIVSNAQASAANRGQYGNVPIFSVGGKPLRG